jgi:uncharacterized protein YaaN involved in tellurite resistance
MNDLPTKIAPAPLPAALDEGLRDQARALARELVAAPAADGSLPPAARAAVEEMGRPLQSESARRSALLQEPLRALARASEDGGPVVGSLAALRDQIEALDPSRFDLSPGWFRRLLGRIPGVGAPLKRYLARFESAQSAIDAISAALERGRDQLRRDNVTLTEDQRGLRDLGVRLERQVEFGSWVDAELHYLLERELPPDDPRRPFVLQDLLFPLRQRIIDLQTQLAVNRQGVLAIGVITQNNQELIRGVDRALNTTLAALQTGVVVALALSHQRRVLDQTSALSRTTSDLIAETGRRLRTQGAEIQRQAAGATLDVATLERAFADVTAAIDDIARYRQEALPKLAQTILTFDGLARDAEARIARADEATGAAPLLSLDPEALRPV